MFILVIPTPTFDARIAPNPLTLPWGGAATVTVSTTPILGFASNISYAFSGFPPEITTGGVQIASPPYTPLAFAFAVAPRTRPGVHTGMLVATWTAFGPMTRSFPMSIIVQPPTLAASFSPAAVGVVDGGPPAVTQIVLTPGGGYAGTPTLTWGAIPAGIEVTPVTLPSPSLPPAQSIPISVRAKGLTPGAHPLALRVVDSGAAIDVTALLVATVALPPDATITVVPPAISVIAGGRASVTVVATGINGFAAETRRRGGPRRGDADQTDVPD